METKISIVQGESGWFLTNKAITPSDFAVLQSTRNVAFQRNDWLDEMDCFSDADRFPQGAWTITIAGVTKLIELGYTVLVDGITLTSVEGIAEQLAEGRRIQEEERKAAKQKAIEAAEMVFQAKANQLLPIVLLKRDAFNTKIQEVFGIAHKKREELPEGFTVISQIEYTIWERSSYTQEMHVGRGQLKEITTDRGIVYHYYDVVYDSPDINCYLIPITLMRAEIDAEYQKCLASFPNFQGADSWLKMALDPNCQCWIDEDTKAFVLLHKDEIVSKANLLYMDQLRNIRAHFLRPDTIRDLCMTWDKKLKESVSGRVHLQTYHEFTALQKVIPSECEKVIEDVEGAITKFREGFENMKAQEAAIKAEQDRLLQIRLNHAIALADSEREKIRKLSKVELLTQYPNKGLMKSWTKEKMLEKIVPVPSVYSLPREESK